MNRKKFLVIAIIVFIVVGISISAFASRNLLQYNDDGKLIVYATEKIPEDVESGTPMVLTLPNIPEKSPDEFQQEEKEKFALEHSDLQNEIVEDDGILPLSIEENIDEPFVVILKKYFGDNEIEDIYIRIFKEIANRNDSKTLTSAQNEILEKTLELIYSTKTTSEEKEILKEALKDEVPNVKDEETLNKINDALK